MGAFALV